MEIWKNKLGEGSAKFIARPRAQSCLAIRHWFKVWLHNVVVMCTTYGNWLKRSLIYIQGSFPMGTTGNGVPTLILAVGMPFPCKFEFLQSIGRIQRFSGQWRNISNTSWSAVSIIPITLADAERGLRTMNIMQPPLRNSWAVPWLSNLLFVNLVGPLLNHFNPMSYAKEWPAQRRLVNEKLGLCRKSAKKK